MKRVHPVKVVWVDSCTIGGWSAGASVREAPPRPTRITTIGVLLENRKGVVVIGQSLSHNTGEVCNLLTIPAAAVKSIQRL